MICWIDASRERAYPALQYGKLLSNLTFVDGIHNPYSNYLKPLKP